MTSIRSLNGLILSLLLTNFVPATDLETIIAKVTECEKKLDGMEAKYQLSSSNLLDDKSAKVIAKSTSKVHVKWNQQQYFGVDSANWTMGDGVKKKMVYSQAFDGKNTRLNNFDEIGNFVDERISPFSVTPMGFGMPIVIKSIPLSTALSFKRTDLSHLSTLGWSSADAKYLGDEKMNGLNCHKIVIEAFSTGDQPSVIVHAWIAPERSYHVIHSETYFPNINPKKSARVFTIKNWHQLEPNLYLPKESVGEYRNWTKDGTLLSGSNSTYQLESVSRLEKPSLKKHFQFPFPKGLTVYELENRKIIKVTVDGKTIKDLREF